MLLHIHDHGIIRKTGDVDKIHLATTIHVNFTHHDMDHWLNMQCMWLTCRYIVTSLNIPAI